MSDAEAQRYGSGPRSAESVLGEPSSPAPKPEATEPEAQPQQAAAEQPKDYSLDPRYREPLMGLIYVGHLEDTFDWGGHRFHIRTLTAGEQIEAGLLIQPALGTRVEMKAHQASWVAAGLITVDGQPLITQLGPKEIEHRERYFHLLKHWHPPTIDLVYSHIYRLELQIRELVDALGEAGGQGA